MTQAKRSFGLSLVSLLLCCSMLLGTTWAWFTDSVTSTNNRIVSGTLDVDLEYYNNGSWEDVTETTNVFKEDTLWEPGHTEIVYLKISNLGSLALKYDFGINIVAETPGINVMDGSFRLSDYIYFGVEEGKQPEYSGREEAIAAVSSSAAPLNAGYNKRASMNSGAPELYVALVVYMPETVGNVANAKAGTPAPTINLGITLKATQNTVEDDTFGTDYDEGALFPDNDVSITVSTPVEADAENKVVSDVTMGEDDYVSAAVSTGTLLEAGTDTLTLKVKELETTSGNITVSDGEESRSVDVHVDGIADGNTVPVIVTVRELMPVGLNMGNYTLYHVENGTPVAMTYVTTTPANHNEFSYDPATGDVVVALCSFSEVAVVAETAAAWEGGEDYTWYAPDATEYTIANGDQLWAFSRIVGGMADGIETDDFSGKTVTLVSDVNLGDDEKNNVENKIFYPIGYYNSTGSYEKVSGGTVTSSVSSFEGTFDGNGHKISNFYHNTWEMFGDYNDGYSGTPNHYKDAMGLFGYVYNGTVKNITVDNFSSDGEFTPTGVIAAYACNSTFENIAITNCNPRVYNTGNGGIVGIGGNSDDPDSYKLTFNNITIDNTNKITALWGSWDVACGGLVGMFRGDGHAWMTNCHVAAQIDAYNDVCGNYQYYWYRYSGMLIGTNKNMTEDANGYTVPETDKYHAEKCTVHFDKWNDYYYCELVANSLASYTHDHQFSRLELVKSVDVEGKTYVTLDGETKNVPAEGRLNLVVLDGAGWETENATCYHFVNGEVWNHEQAGYDVGIDENGDGKDDLKEDKQHVYLPFNQLFTGYGWGVKHVPVGAFSGVTILEREVADSETKFVAKYENNTFRIGDGCAVSVGELFEAIDGMNINTSGVFVSVEALNSDSPVVGKFTANKSDWRKSTITFNGIGAVKLTIQDYDYCKPTTLYINVDDMLIESDDANTKIIGLAASKTYKYAPVNVLGFGEWTTVSGVTEIDVETGLWAIRFEGNSEDDCEYILVGDTAMSLVFLNADNKKDVNTTDDGNNLKGWDIGYWTGGNVSVNDKQHNCPTLSTKDYAAMQFNYTVPTDNTQMHDWAKNLLTFNYANAPEQIIPVDKLTSVKFGFAKNGGNIGLNIWEDKTTADFIGSVRVYVAGSDVDYYEIPFNWNGVTTFEINFKNSLPANAKGYVTGLSILPWGATPDDWVVQDGYSDVDDTTALSRWVVNYCYLYHFNEVASATTSELTVIGGGANGGYIVGGFDFDKEYLMSSDGVNYKSIGKGFATYTVPSKGTFFFKIASGYNAYESASFSVTIDEGAQAPVTGLTVDGMTVLGLYSDKHYEYAPVDIFGFGEWTDVPAGSTEISTEAGLWAIRIKAGNSLVAGAPAYVLVGDTAMNVVFDDTATGKKGIYTTGTDGSKTTGWDLGKWSSSMTSLTTVSVTSTTFAKMRYYYGISNDTETAYEYARNRLDYKYANMTSEIIPVGKLNTIQFSFSHNGTMGTCYWENKTSADHIGLIVIYVAGSNVNSYEIPFNWNGSTSFKLNLANLLPDDANGYVTGIRILPHGGAPDGWEAQDDYRDTDPTSAWGTAARSMPLDLNIYSLTEFPIADAPVIALNGIDENGGYVIDGFNSALTYEMSSDGGVTYNSIGTGFTTYTVPTEGTFFFKVSSSNTYYESNAVFVKVDGVQESVSGLTADGMTIKGLSTDKAYEYAPVDIFGFGEWTDVPENDTEITVETGLWAVRIKASETRVAGAPDYVLVGETAMNPVFYNEETKTKDANVSKDDGDAILGWDLGCWSSGIMAVTETGNKNSHNAECASFYYSYNIPWDDNAKMHDWAKNKLSFNYANTAAEIIPVSQLGSIKFAFGTAGHMGFTAWEGKTKADYIAAIRVYVADSDVDYYEVPFNWNGKTTFTFNFKDILPADAEGYVTGVSILPYGGTPSDWVVQDQYTDADPTVVWPGNWVIHYLRLYYFN